jgi:hypothetical protein
MTPARTLIRYLNDLLIRPAAKDESDGELRRRFALRREESAFAGIAGICCGCVGGHGQRF